MIKGLSSLRVAGTFLMIVMLLLSVTVLKLDGIYAAIILLFMMLVVFAPDK